MYTVLIVDDEMLVRVGLKSMLDWEKEGFRIIGEADNGEKALAIIRQRKLDIVITDYRMPVMDGILLLMQCKKEQLPSKFIILSAYSDFEYVRSTLKNGATDYLLKLELEPEKLLDALHKAAEQLRPETEKTAREVSDLSLSNLRHAYRQLINGCGPSCQAECQALLQQAGAPVSSIAIAAYHVLSASRQELPSAQFGEAVGTIRDVIEDIVQSGVPSVTLSLHRDGVLCTVFQGDGEAVGVFSKLALRIRETIQYLFNFRIYCGCSLVKPGLNKLHEAWQEALDSMRYAEIYDLDFCSAAARAQWDDGQKPDESLLSSVSSAMESMDYEKLHQTLCRLSAQTLHNRPGVQQLGGLCYLLVFQLGSLLRHMCVPENEALEVMYAWQSKAHYIFTCENAIAFIREIDLEFQKRMAGEEEYPYIARAKAYIQEHLSENILLEDVAGAVSLSPNYFSKLFHQRAGENLTAYIARQKVNAAKAQLLSGRMNVNEVSDALGFNNATYFSKVFKKYTGYTPQGYQQHARHETAARPDEPKA